MEYTISVSDEGTTILTGQPETVELAERRAELVQV